MDEELSGLITNVRIDRESFTREVASLKSELERPLADGAAAAGRSIEAALSKAVRSSRSGFGDLRSAALSTLSEIAAAALKVDLPGTGSTRGPGLDSLLTLAGSLLGGQPGRATGGPVSPGQAYVVGERGPELFLPTASGRVVETGTGRAKAPVNLTVNVATPVDAGPAFMARTGAQIARAARAALERAGA